uniref:Reactive oxygen species modulator 1 n=1 Tax=Aquila chrysaetos chrysaetos TaxID=223781 RepID=A0A663E0W1_AQUCH
MPVTVGPYGQSQPSCFDRVKMGFMMGFAVGMAAGALFGTFSCLRIGMRGRELMGGVGKTMMQSGGTFGTFMAIVLGSESPEDKSSSSAFPSDFHGTPQTGNHIEN